jgi:hypothetical protein
MVVALVASLFLGRYDKADAAASVPAEAPAPAA